MFRIFLCSFALLGFITIKAQTIDADIETGVRLYNEMRAYESKLNNITFTDSSINRLNEYITKANPLFKAVLANGSLQQQKIARYITGLFQYDLGFAYGRKGDKYNSYAVLKKIDNDLQYFSDSTLFPLRYKFDNQNYSIPYINFAPFLAEYYTGMGELCTDLKKYPESATWLQQAINLPYMSPWLKYIAASKLWENARYQNKSGAPYIELTLAGLQYCSRLDTLHQGYIRVYHYANCRQFADTLDKLVQNPFYIYKADAYAKAAAYLDSANETAYAISFYRKAIARGLNDRVFLRKAATFAAHTNDAVFQQEIAAELKRSYAYEKDEVIRNLSIVLPQLVASAGDPSKHFSEMRGKKMKSIRYGGKMYHASVELPGAIESFVTEFLGNNVANTYYWKSFIDEEAPAQLQGRLKQRYKSLCDEIKSIYPNAPVKYEFDNENYFQMKLTGTTTIELNYYYNEGYKDVILLSVFASYSK